MRVYEMYCGGCGRRLEVPEGAETVTCPGCQTARHIGVDWPALRAAEGLGPTQ